MRLSDVATVEQSTRNRALAARFNDQPAVLLIITKQRDANVIETVDRIQRAAARDQALDPRRHRHLGPVRPHRARSAPACTTCSSRSALSIVLVMLVVFLFLRRPTPTIAAGITVPLSLAGTCAAMWCAGFSINNLSLMALAVSVGFVVDDAIVMIENMFRNLEARHARRCGPRSTARARSASPSSRSASR